MGTLKPSATTANSAVCSCGFRLRKDLSHDPPDAALPAAVAEGKEPSVVGAVAGRRDLETAWKIGASQSMMKVLISGAGIAGPTLADWLLHYGMEPTIIEKAPRLRSGGYVVDFWDFKGHGVVSARALILSGAVAL